MADDPRPPLVLSFDFEDWHQLVYRAVGVAGADVRHAAFERQIEAILALLEELNIRATFFLLGMTVENYPDLARRVAEHGCEVASHGYGHERVYRQDAKSFGNDVARSLDLIAEVTGRRPAGYRAPAFSINRRTPWAYEVLAKLGLRYDSSQYDSPRIPDRIHPVPQHPYPIALEGGRELWEFPIATWPVGGRSLPIGGGGYWRVVPRAVLLRALGHVAADGGLPVTYLHPYECDPEALEIALPPEASTKQRVRAQLRRAQRNLGRGRIRARLRDIAQHFRIVTYEEAHAEIEQRYGSRPRALSPQGALV
jgi:polysaccharide deacetylase family protein (PEP-CTERM system associated)